MTMVMGQLALLLPFSWSGSSSEMVTSSSMSSALSGSDVTPGPLTLAGSPPAYHHIRKFHQANSTWTTRLCSSLLRFNWFCNCQRCGICGVIPGAPGNSDFSPASITLRQEPAVVTAVQQASQDRSCLPSLVLYTNCECKRRETFQTWQSGEET